MVFDAPRPDAFRSAAPAGLIDAVLNALPGFEPEIQGVYLNREADGSRRAYGYVVKEASA